MKKTIRILCLVAAMWIGTAVAWSQVTMQSKATSMTSDTETGQMTVTAVDKSHGVLHEGVADEDVDMKSTPSAFGSKLSFRHKKPKVGHVPAGYGEARTSAAVSHGGKNSISDEVATLWGGDKGADGTEANPYVITTTDGLNQLASEVISGNELSGMYFRLDNDIEYSYDNANSTENNFTAIGYYDGYNDYYFKGHFDGCGHTVKGIRIYKGGTNDADDCQGLFGQIGNGGSVSHLTLDDARITGFNYTGGIVGYNEGGTITDCHVTANVCIHAVQSDADQHGGIVGQINGGAIVSGCTSRAVITIAEGAESCWNYGGIVGYNAGSTIKDCLYLGGEIGGDRYVGAIAGYNPIGTIENCYFKTLTDGPEEKEVKVLVWTNDGSHGEINWSGEYRFAPESNSTGEECYTVPQDIWKRLKTETFYVTIKGANPQIRVTTGWWSTTWTGDDIFPGNERLKDNEDGTFTLTVNFEGDPLLDFLDDQHLLFTGGIYTVEEIYFIDIESGSGNITAMGEDYEGIGYIDGTVTNVGYARTVTLDGDLALDGTMTNYAEDVENPALQVTAYATDGHGFALALTTGTTTTIYSVADAEVGIKYEGTLDEGYLVEEKVTKTSDNSDVTGEVVDANGVLTVPAYDVSLSATVEDVWGVSGDNPNDGSETKPYTISTTKGLDLLAKKVNGGNEYQGKYFVLNNDLDYSDVEKRFDKSDDGVYQSNYQTIGGNFEGDDKYFKGSFNGDGHTVSGITIVKNGTGDGDRYQGLFGSLGEGGSVSHVTLDASSITGYHCTGGIVGCNKQGTITDCHVTDGVSIKAAQGDAYEHGGIVGFNFSTGSGGLVMGCTSAANISGADQGTNNGDFGGIAGNNNGTIKDCIYLGGEIGGNKSVGAIVGKNERNYVLNCYFTTAGLKGIDNHQQVTTDNGAGSAIGCNNGLPTNVGLARTITLDKDVAFDGTATDYAATVANPQTAVTAYAAADELFIDFGYTDDIGFALTLTTGDGTTAHYSVAPATVGIKYTGTLPAGATPTFTVTAYSGDAISVTASGSAYSFLMPADNVTVSVMTGTTVSVAAQSWATYCIDQAVSLAAGQTDCGLYTLSAVGTESVTLSEITGTASAGTPLMIWNGSDEPKTVVLNYAAEPATATDHADEFVGTLDGIAVSDVSAAAVYVLYNNRFMRTLTGSIPAHRAYIALPTANAARSLSIGSTTGITAPSAGETGTVYDMSGRKVNSPTRNGVYIINGKKIVINDKK